MPTRIARVATGLWLGLFTFALAHIGCSGSHAKHASGLDGGAGGSTGGKSVATAGSGGARSGSGGGAAGHAAAGTGGGASAPGTGGSSAGGHSATDAGMESDGGSTASNGDAFPGDTYLPWAGGSDYFTKWPNGPPADPTFFPIAVWLQTPSNAARYKKVGINLFVGLWQGPTEDQLTTLKSAGVPTFCDQGGVWKAHTSDSTVWGWLQPDEPDNAQAKASGSGYDPCIAPSTIISGRDTMVANDPTRPVWLGLGRGVSDTTWVGRGTCTGMTDMYADYAKGGDILSFDIYPVNDGDALEAVPKGVDNLRMWSGYTKPVVADIEGSNINDTTRPTPAQIKSEVWMALVHGAAGIQYFCHRFKPSFSETDCLDDATTAAALPGINAQITQLAPVLNTRSVANGVSVSSSASDKPVDTLLKRYGGATYLFAVEMRSGTTKASFSLRGLPASVSAEVLGENRNIDVADGAFDDSFTDYGVHLYKLSYSH